MNSPARTKTTQAAARRRRNQEKPIPQYVFFFTYTGNAWARMLDNPGDRTAAVRRIVESLDGSLECLYWMLGTHDGIAIVQLPDSAHAATLSAMITSTGAFKTVQTHELLTQEQLSRTLQLASSARQAFQPPGQPWPIRVTRTADRTARSTRTIKRLATGESQPSSRLHECAAVVIARTPSEMRAISGGRNLEDELDCAT